jgi:uncharacterized protein DUF3140
VGQKRGHASGRRTATVLRTPRAELSDDDYAHMRNVVGYAKRHLAQRPHGDVSETAWRYSLTNWGHDPTRSWLADFPPASRPSPVSSL